MSSLVTLGLGLSIKPIPPNSPDAVLEAIAPQDVAGAVLEPITLQAEHNPPPVEKVGYGE